VLPRSGNVFFDLIKYVLADRHLLHIGSTFITKYADFHPIVFNGGVLLLVSSSNECFIVVFAKLSITFCLESTIVVGFLFASTTEYEPSVTPFCLRK
jgi:hypothetical protein